MDAISKLSVSELGNWSVKLTFAEYFEKINECWLFSLLFYLLLVCILSK